MYSLLRPLLFNMEAERSHDLGLRVLQTLSGSQLALKTLSKLYADKVPAKPLTLMGLKLKHPIGLAAGLDKQGVAGDAFNALGFAWVEYGTVTPQPQAGNAKPRLFRLVQHQALINRFGFNSIGLEAFLENIKASDPNAIKGLNIGKNASTPMDQANADYVLGMQSVYALADYICVNISSPNTQDLRALQSAEPLDSLLATLSNARKELEDKYGYKRPVVLKIAPDMDSSQIDYIAKCLSKYQIDGLVATNTTVSRRGADGAQHAHEKGGLSGAPLAEQATHCIAQFRQRLQGEVAIIGVGGICDANSARAKLDAGADALQLYTGLIYQGPKIIRQIVRGL